jgi:glycosyltransferase involved in cell wall biosynthesis
MGYEVLQFVTESKASMGDGFRLFFTHHNLNFELNNYQQILDRVHTVYTMNQRVSQLLLSTGIEETKIRCVYGAVDREKFFPKAGKAEMGTNNFCLHGESEYVLISGDCKERKNPALILSVVKQNPSLNFVIHGRGWENMVRNFSGSNLTYIKFDSRSHPILMRNASTYLSLSSLEGGPYPTLEALASGTPVVATNTGWNSEVIPDGAGVILPINTGTSEVTTALRYSIERKPKVEGKDLLMGKFTWEELGAALFPETK